MYCASTPSVLQSPTGVRVDSWWKDEKPEVVNGEGDEGERETVEEDGNLDGLERV